jgi:hypothetical protein
MSPVHSDTAPQPDTDLAQGNVACIKEEAGEGRSPEDRAGPSVDLAPLTKVLQHAAGCGDYAVIEVRCFYAFYSMRPPTRSPRPSVYCRSHRWSCVGSRWTKYRTCHGTAARMTP